MIGLLHYFCPKKKKKVSPELLERPPHLDSPTLALRRRVIDRQIDFELKRHPVQSPLYIKKRIQHILCNIPDRTIQTDPIEIIQPLSRE